MYGVAGTGGSGSRTPNNRAPGNRSGKLMKPTTTGSTGNSQQGQTPAVGSSNRPGQTGFNTSTISSGNGQNYGAAGIIGSPRDKGMAGGGSNPPGGMGGSDAANY